MTHDCVRKSHVLDHWCSIGWIAHERLAGSGGKGTLTAVVWQSDQPLSLERSFGFSGFGAKIFQVIIGNATDTSGIASLKGNLGQIEPLKKKLLLDLSELGIELDNLEGMTLGPVLPDGSRSLVLVSDDNFRDEQVSQFLLFRLVEDK